MELIGLVWTRLLVEPLLNTLIFLYIVLFHNMALSIVMLTVIVRVATFPLTRRQLRMTQAQAALAPRLEEVNRRYKGDPQRRSKETMRLYKEGGINPLGCLGPLVIQMPIWIGLYWAIIKGIGNTPGTMVYLSQHLYPWLPGIMGALPIDARFLWMDLTQAPAQTEPAILASLLPVLVGGSMWVVQKMTMPAVGASSQQQSTSRMMLYMFPIMFGWLSFTFPAGLALYWFISNVVTVIMQYFIIGWGGLRPAAVPAGTTAQAAAEERTRDEHAESRDISADGRRGDPARPRPARRRPRRGRSGRPRSR